MHSSAKTPDEYIKSLPEERKEPMAAIRDEINKNLPKGFDEIMAGGMLNWVVPHSAYPSGYHCDPKAPLPFIGLASQKQYISLYHMALVDGPLLYWFQAEWESVMNKKLDMGKCCVRFKKMKEVPYDLVGELASKMTPTEWIENYEANYKR